jgi:hypothetical protein
VRSNTQVRAATCADLGRPTRLFVSLGMTPTRSLLPSSQSESMARTTMCPTQPLNTTHLWATRACSHHTCTALRSCTDKCERASSNGGTHTAVARAWRVGGRTRRRRWLETWRSVCTACTDEGRRPRREEALLRLLRGSDVRDFRLIRRCPSKNCCWSASLTAQVGRYARPALLFAHA